jgi:D-alanyl-D-alanine carboxypeptidase (penicillin-binding protein 5/6)
MTALLTLERAKLSDTYTAANYNVSPIESQIGLQRGEKMKVSDLMRGLLLESGNDAAVTLAEGVSGSRKAFVKAMNRRAKQLGLDNTHYANPIGLDQRGNHSSARDLAALTEQLLRIPAFARIAASRSALLRSVHPRRRIATVNELLRMAPWVTGVKTGHTLGARYVLVGSGRRKGVELIAVAIGAPTDEDRFRDDFDLLRYGFSRYRRRVPIRAGRVLARPVIRYSDGELPLRPPRTVAVGVRPAQRLSIQIRAPDEVEGPIARGAPLGTATVFVDGLRAAVVPLLAAREVPRASAIDRVRSFAGDNALALALAACAILIGLVFVLRRRVLR